MFTIVGLVVWGVSIDENYHWMVGQVAFFLCEYYLPVYIAFDAELTIL
jgi:hypothetical protein